jgi:Family of unknown function (DUF6152)
MKTHRMAGVSAGLLLASFLTIPVRAQTASELLQKGIYTQETAGDLDGAIAIYRQIVNSGSSPRDVAAQAQYRLAQTLLQKGDLPNGAQEFTNLSRNYADYGKLVSSLASQAGRSDGTIRLRLSDGTNLTGDQQAEAERLRAEVERLKAAIGAPATDPAAADRLKALIAEVQARQVALSPGAAQFLGAGVPGGRGGRGMGVGVGPGVSGGISSMSFDSNSPVTVTGAAVFKVEWLNPNATISVDPKDGTGKKYTFVMASPNQLIKQGMTRASLSPGDEVTVTGVLATGGQTLPDGTIAASASTVTRADGKKLFDRAAVVVLSNPCNWVSATVPAPCGPNTAAK